MSSEMADSEDAHGPPSLLVVDRVNLPLLGLCTCVAVGSGGQIAQRAARMRIRERFLAERVAGEIDVDRAGFEFRA